MSEVVENEAAPVASSVAVFSVLAPSRKLTEPLAAEPEDSFTVAVRVTLAPVLMDVELADSVVVVGTTGLITVTVTALDVEDA